MGMRFHVCVGILAHEREFAQPLEVDLRCRHDADGRVSRLSPLYEDHTSNELPAIALTYLEPLRRAHRRTRAHFLRRVTWCEASRCASRTSRWVARSHRAGVLWSGRNG